jgi:hypothetical protein
LFPCATVALWIERIQRAGAYLSLRAGAFSAMRMQRYG